MPVHRVRSTRSTSDFSRKEGDAPLSRIFVLGILDKRKRKRKSRVPIIIIKTKASGNTAAKRSPVPEDTLFGFIEITGSTASEQAKLMQPAVSIT
jgi:hypothetical protein